jgi:hypothetical protein
MPDFRGVAISGKSHAGKDTLAEALQIGHGVFFRVALADEPKRILGGITGLDLFDRPTRDRHRQLLSDFAELLCRHDPHIWTGRALAAARSRAFGIPIITDLRKPEEAHAFQQARFMLVRLDCPWPVRQARGATRTLGNHVSECGLDDFGGFHLRLRSDMETPVQLAERVVDAYLDGPETAMSRTVRSVPHVHEGRAVRRARSGPRRVAPDIAGAAA